MLNLNGHLLLDPRLWFFPSLKLNSTVHYHPDPAFCGQIHTRSDAFARLSTTSIILHHYTRIGFLYNHIQSAANQQNNEIIETALP